MQKLLPRIFLTLAVTVVTAVTAGCDGSDFGNPRLTHSGGGCAGAEDGVIVLTWTIRGAAPSATSCSGIDHLELDLEGQSCDVTIEPIPCMDDHWRYDQLPEGQVQATLTALNSAGAVVATAVQEVNLTGDVPPSPTPLALQ